MSASDNLSNELFKGRIEGPEQRLTDKNGKVKYYSSHKTAWDAAARMNQKMSPEEKGNWYFEGDDKGWYVHKDLNG